MRSELILALGARESDEESRFLSTPQNEPRKNAAAPANPLRQLYPCGFEIASVDLPPKRRSLEVSEAKVVGEICEGAQRSSGEGRA